MSNKPVFVMVMGFPGAGKSTFRSEFKGASVQLSTDDLIEDAAQFQGKTYSEAFLDEIGPATAATNAAFHAALKDGASIIWDQTNLTRKKREKVLRQIPDGYHKIIVHVTCDEDERQRRLADRPGKVIPPNVDENMRRSFQPPMMEEGWDEIMNYKSDAQ